MRFTILRKKKTRKKKQSLQSASLVALQDAASARYIYTRPVTVLSCFIVWKSFQKNLEWRTSVRLAPIARMLFCSLDDPVLEYQALRTVCHHLALSSCPFLFFCPNFSMFKAEEGQKIEPYWHDTQWMLRRSLTHGQIEWSDMAKLLMRYAPIIPMILVNGSEGIGRQML